MAKKHRAVIKQQDIPVKNAALPASPPPFLPSYPTKPRTLWRVEVPHPSVPGQFIAVGCVCANKPPYTIVGANERINYIVGMELSEALETLIKRRCRVFFGEETDVVLPMPKEGDIPKGIVVH